MDTTVIESTGIRLHIVMPPPDLAPYITTYYRTEAVFGGLVDDWLPPESANLRVGRAKVYQAGIGEAVVEDVPTSILSGPTSRATRLRIEDGTFWGVGLLPLGFAKFLGVPASDYADRFCATARVPALDPLRPMLDHLARSSGDMKRDVAVMNRSFRALLDRPLAQAERIVRAHEAIVADHSHSVASLAEEVEVGTRTLERFCLRHFGFTPKLLLRRQRFLRSLARFMVDPSMKWIGSLDSHYHDQAQFVREFRWFMLMRPGEYARMDHPIAMAAVRARRAAAGEAMQALHRPDPADIATDSDEADA